MQSYAKHVSFLNNLEGLRAVASIGIVLTHVGFQTGVDPATFVGGILTRFDFFVAVFFALSAFLLWRHWGGGVTHSREWCAYYRSRVSRIMPAYVVFVVFVLLVFPEAYASPPLAIVANMTLTQIYFPNGLLPGLTHLWSLCIEAAFYLVLPLAAWAVSTLPQRLRVPAILAVAVLSLGWAFLPFVDASPAPGVPNMQIFPPAFTCWFVVGILAAEVEGRVGSRGRRWLRRRWLWLCIAVVVLVLAAQPFFGPAGLVHPTAPEFVRRILAGTVFAAAVLVPQALDPDDSGRILQSRAVRMLGRWAYGIFLWHLPMLGFTFPILGIRPFSGYFFPVLVVTLVLTIPVAAASYIFVEQSARKFFSKSKKKPTENKIPT